MVDTVKQLSPKRGHNAECWDAMDGTGMQKSTDFFSKEE